MKRLLLDTNIAIALEDAIETSTAIAAFARASERHDLKLFVCDANYEDVARDANRVRRELTTSKLNKYLRISDAHLPSREVLASSYGAIRKPNDLCDCQLLAIANAEVVDFLISEDRDLRKRAVRAGVDDRVLNVEEALEWIAQTFEPNRVELPYIQEVAAYSVDLSDQFFDSLREDYPEFDRWFKEKCIPNHRSCWVVRLEGKLAGLVIRKEESQSEASCVGTANKILKICTFKMSPEFQGEKFGEQLLKQILWWAQRNGIELVYLTAYSKQEVLIDLLFTYGFAVTGELENGERILERQIYQQAILGTQDLTSRVEINRVCYPRVFSDSDTKGFCIPIRPAYVSRLFPEVAEMRQGRLFEEELNRTPGNTIRKVYLSRSKSKQLRAGDLVFFYMSKDPLYYRSQSITTLGVVEAVQEISGLDGLIRLTAKRSVFSLDDLRLMVEEKPTPIMVLDFLLVAHVDPAISLSELNDTEIFVGHPPQGIMNLPVPRFEKLKELLASRGIQL